MRLVIIVANKPKRANWPAGGKGASGGNPKGRFGSVGQHVFIIRHRVDLGAGWRAVYPFRRARSKPLRTFEVSTANGNG